MSADSAGKAPAGSAARTSRMECTLGNDSRLFASLGAVISHAAKRAGLPEHTQEELTHAAVEAAREISKAGNGTGSGTAATKLILDEFPDRLEFHIESAGGASMEEIRKRLEGKFGDRVRCEGRDGRARVTLIKPCGVAKLGSAS
jgi:anti-sigma regulatory factor (Ser/Thr protein kinase)